MVERKQAARAASSGEGEIHSRLWLGKEQRAVIQIAHGMAEHSARYDDFAAYLAERGFVVCANDHAGHGLSVVTKGYFAKKDGWEHAVRDMHNLMEEVTRQHSGVPVFLLGHSMGSFLSRSYIVRYTGLAGCVLSGTAGKNPAVGMGKAVASLQKVFKGAESEGKFLGKLAKGGYNDRIENPVNEHAWLAAHDAVPLDFANDPLSGFNLSAGGFYDMFTGLAEVTAPDWAGNVPCDLPLYLFAGEEDPVGDYGKGPRETYEALLASGHDAELKLYPGGRHEMLNEANKEEVYADVFAWLERHL